MILVTIDIKEVAEMMVEKYGFDPTKENMEFNYSNALLASLTGLYDLEGKVDQALDTINDDTIKEEGDDFSLETVSKDHLDMCGLSKDSTLEEAKYKMLWGTYGKPFNYDNFRYKRLIDCSTDHLQAILETQIHAAPDIIRVIKGILKDRGVK